MLNIYLYFVAVESFNDNDYEDLVQQQQELIDYLTTANNGEMKRKYNCVTMRLILDMSKLN